MTIDEFKKIELRVGTILETEKVEGSEKLLKLKVDLGEPEPRQILAGIAKMYAPESLLGRQTVFVANLEPRQLMGLTSQGMILAVSDKDGQPILLNLDQPVKPGELAH